jgi:hypothetical protein
MSHAVVNAQGKVKQLDQAVEPDEVVTEDDVKDASKLSRLNGRLLKGLALLRRAWAPRVIDFQDVPCTAGTPIRLPHGFGGRVNYWVLSWRALANAPNFMVNATTDNNTLVLDVGVSGTGTIRVEAAG